MISIEAHARRDALGLAERALHLEWPIALLALVIATCTFAAEPFPYDEAADAKADVAAGRQSARDSQRLLLLSFGANWCPDCRRLALAMANEPIASSVARDFVVVKVDVGNWDKNLDLVDAYGNPIAKGIPSVVVVDPATNKGLYATRAGELATARNMSDAALNDFFRALAGTHGPKSP